MGAWLELLENLDAMAALAAARVRVDRRRACEWTAEERAAALAGAGLADPDPDPGPAQMATDDEGGDRAVA